MDANITRAVVALSQLPKVGRVRLRNVLKKLKDQLARPLSLSDVVERCKDQIPSFSDTELAAAEAKADNILEHCGKLDIVIHYLGSSSYPSQLERLAEPPGLLFTIGSFQPDQKPRIAVIGTREPTDWGLQTAKACAAQIASSHGVVVSGLALGIDAAAQESSVEHDGPTWAVLAHGLHTVSPSSNRPLAKRILEKGGALISEYPPGEPAQRHYFVERDRIQAGLSDAVLVIESGVDGGAMHTVRFAEQAHVDVWVTVPHHGVATDVDEDALPKVQQGTWSLLVRGRAKRVTTPRALHEMISNLVAPAHPEEQPIID